MTRLLTAFSISFVAFAACPETVQAAEPASAIDVFNSRIMPIFRSDKPSSCIQCHLSAVDLKNYILPSSEMTFASLRDQGLIDLDKPEASKILTLIRMGEKDLDKGARLIHEKNRKAEREAFSSWIKACCDDPRIRNLPRIKETVYAKPSKSNAVIRHARKSRVVDSFARNIFSQRMRCFPCHTPHEIDKSNPKHQAAIKTHKKFTEKYSPKMLERLSFFKKTPEATMDFLVQRSLESKDNELPMLDLKNPTRSLLVLKPLSKLPAKKADGTFEDPSSLIPTSHMGGLKMHANDQSYKSFIAWIQDYAKVTGDQYATVNELPADNWHATKQILKLTAAPQSWKVGTPVQLFVHTWDSTKKQWNESPTAFTQGTVTPRRMVNGAMFLLRASNSKPEASRQKNALARGNYQVRVFVDRNNRLEKDPTLLLSNESFAGKTVLKNARWREGFRQAETVNATLIEK
jgi:hypothetical protein